MKVTSKQRNSKMCMICGLENEYGLRAPFYNMEDGSVMSLFKYREQHQSYPGRVHGGLITAMLDEMGLRFTLDTKYRKPVPYDVDLVGKGIVVRDTSKFVVTEASIMDMMGNVLANGTIKYIKQDIDKISENISMHNEMFLVEDGVKEI